MKISRPSGLIVLAVVLASFLLASAACGRKAAAPAPSGLERGFVQPPVSAKPWVYWFWLNGNITREGITADLEAMRRAGIGGVLIMEVDQGAPVGPVGFMSQDWRALFRHAVVEAERLGLEINMNNDAGWNGSGGPWIKPEQSMQAVVWSETDLSGPRKFSGVLSQPKTIAAYYGDITVLAFPALGKYRIADIKAKAGYEVGTVGSPARADLAPSDVIVHGRIVDLQAHMDGSGRLTWDVPAGRWTVVRFGHASTGVENAPAPKSGRGLECDKLSRGGIEANYAGMMDKLISDAGPAAGKSLVATHIDSWENGSQNWTAAMRDEFSKRRGYDLWLYLPVLTGRVVGSLEISERFLWDLRRTISELVIEKYARGLGELARARGLRLSIEAYGGPCDNLPYAGEADEPMCEFWMGGGAFETVKGMASAVHTYGKTILGAEAFTAGGREKWLEHPASIKELGDHAFCDGVNRFVFHRYALQPWLDRRPGMTMGPWGLHYERTQTWWELTPGWHEYLARCQFMLRQGQFAADICYLQPEAPPQSFSEHPRRGYDWDEACAEVVMERMTVKDGRLVLPGGMSYRVLALPDSAAMTPGLLAKVVSLVKDGATVVGPRPQRSPSLSGYPACDDEVKRLADELWADCDGKAVLEHRLGKGRIVWGETPEKVLEAVGVRPDFECAARWRYIHRVDGDADIYFVSNPEPYEVAATAAFRVSGKVPELWWPDTGRIERAAAFERKGGITSVLLPLGPSGSVFVVFREADAGGASIVSATRDGKPLWSTAFAPVERLIVEKAVYGVPGDAVRTRDVRDKVQRLADMGETSFRVARMAEDDDPALNIVKTLVLEYKIGSKPVEFKATDPETIVLRPSERAEPAVELRRTDEGRLGIEASRPGVYAFSTASGKTIREEIASIPASVEIPGPWEITFPPGWGAPEKITFDRLVSWTEHPDSGVKHFSGTAIYRAAFAVPDGVLGDAAARRVYLDLGDVRVIARVKLNEKDLGVFWKPPYRADVTEILKSGQNTLDVQVANLWPNRMIGDEALPDDSPRNKDGTLKEWPAWLNEGKASPTGRFTFTSWRLWKKGDPLVPSGLLGPVTLAVSEIRSVKW
ncbi:MAG: glycosyl hydrolase [Candidatus Aminicenantes bacterium]|nr:glycosyl hydrolase [Candidatus Aminicenantes bacterium]